MKVGFEKMNRTRTASRTLLFVAILAVVLPGASAFGQVVSDVVTVATVSGSGVVDVPVYIRDTALTTLGIDQPSGSRIQSYSLRVSYSPAASVQSISFSRAGITAPLSPTFESSPAVPGAIALLDNFDETTNLIPFTSNAALPGNQVAHLLVTLSPSALPGSIITLTLDPVLTQLTDEGGTPATVETTGNGRLTLVNGAINVTAPAAAVPTASTWALVLLAATLAVVAIRMRLS
jgi:hypothetical protein